MRAKLREVKEEMRWRRHHSIPEQGNWLRLVVTGFFAYHAVPTNIWALGTFRFWIIDLWRRSLRRRSQKDRTTWRRITKLADDFLLRARILHPRPEVALALSTRGGSRVPELGTLGSVRGALSNERPYRDLRNVVTNYPVESSIDFRESSRIPVAEHPKGAKGDDETHDRDT
jgi:RNA-directed DNA polymerase